MRRMGIARKASTTSVIVMIIFSLIVLFILFFFSGKAIEWISGIIDKWFG